MPNQSKFNRRKRTRCGGYLPPGTITLFETGDKKTRRIVGRRVFCHKRKKSVLLNDLERHPTIPLISGVQTGKGLVIGYTDKRHPRSGDSDFA